MRIREGSSSAEEKGSSAMNPPQPAPNIPGNTPAERMSNALRMVLRVSKPDLLKREARVKRANIKRRAKKATQ